MVHYELAVIFRPLSKLQLSTALRGACTTLLGQGSMVRSMENRGERRLPYSMGAHKERFTHGRYFIFDFDAPPNTVKLILTRLRSNKDIIRASVMHVDTV